MTSRRPAQLGRSCLLAMVAAGAATDIAFAQTGVDPSAPLSSMVAVRLTVSGEENIPQYIKRLVDLTARDELKDQVNCTIEFLGMSFPCPRELVEVPFPLENAITDSVRTVLGFEHNVVASWLDPLTQDSGTGAPRYGANNDYIAYFGDGWDADWSGDVVGSAPQFRGDGTSGWIWTNHEYVSNSQPTTTTAPVGQHLTLAKFLQDGGVLRGDLDVELDGDWTQDDVDTYIRWFKRQLGGTWMRVFQDQTSGEWMVDRDADNIRYDSTDATLLTVTGFTLQEPDNLDDGTALPEGKVVGILGDCSGGQTPWGTILSAEENVQDYYGDLETAWTSQQQFVAGAGFDPGANIAPDVTPSEAGQFGQISNPIERHNRDVYGFLAEMDPGQAPDWWYISAAEPRGDGEGHRKFGAMGRARWENATLVTDGGFNLIPGKPIVIYAANDRRSGRIYKWVSGDNYQEGMTRGQVRALLDGGQLYVAHFAGLDNRTGFTLFDAGDTDCDPEPAGQEAEIAERCTLATEEAPGNGQWILMSVANDSQEAPNAAALGAPGTTVGAALQDVNWNNIGGFPTQNDVLSALFTAAMKIGVMELNRPEDVEWNPNFPGGPVIHVAFTKNGRQVALNQDGVLFDPASHAEQSPLRIDAVGSIFTLREADAENPGTSTTFTYWMNWLGTRGDGIYDAADPDNLMVDREGGLWFGTDGNFGLNGTADAVYYLDLDPSHKEGAEGVVNPTFGLPFRVAAGPSDSEATGPALSSDMRTLFFNVQHPGEDVPDVISNWPPR